ncbi:MAG: hypothetical protein ACRC0S_05115 [Fusobacteriaceae bacterium]
MRTYNKELELLKRERKASVEKQIKKYTRWIDEEREHLEMDDKMVNYFKDLNEEDQVIFYKKVIAERNRYINSLKELIMGCEYELNSMA